MSTPCLISLIVFGLIMFFGVIPTFIMSYFLYRALFVRRNSSERTRHCSFPEDEEYVKMYSEGLEWGKDNEKTKVAVEIESEGAHLFGEYFDFGFKKAVIIIPGRTEDCTYSYYFSEPYKQAGCNVLCIDNRAHGLSDGKCHNFGATEYKDILKWSQLLHDKYGNEVVILHGICIGAQVALRLMTREECPAYIKAMVTEGMFTTFKASFDEHMREGHHPIFPFSLWVMAWIRIRSHANVLTQGPIKWIGSLKKPILMLHSRQDKYSTPEQGEILNELCTAPKKMVWFDEGEHSRIRPKNKEAFDREIKEFVEKLTNS